MVWRVLRDFWLPSAVATISGGVMMVAGYLLRTQGPGTARLATLPGGVLIVVAFATIRRQPTRRARVVALSLTMIAGAVMVFAGYTLAGHGWALAMIAALAGSLLISAVFAAVARGVAT